MKRTDPKQYDAGALILRLSLGAMMLFHGIDKVVHGIDWMGPALAAKGLPALLSYGVYLGEVVAPVFLILGPGRFAIPMKGRLAQL